MDLKIERAGNRWQLAPTAGWNGRVANLQFDFWVDLSHVLLLHLHLSLLLLLSTRLRILRCWYVSHYGPKKNG